MPEKPIAYARIATITGAVTGVFTTDSVELRSETLYPIYPAKVMDALLKDAARYRWLRKQNWFGSKLCVVRDLKPGTPHLGLDCPSLDRLDSFIDAFMEKENA